MSAQVVEGATPAEFEAAKLIRPIRPDEVAKIREVFQPEIVARVLNILITRFWDGRGSSVPADVLAHTLCAGYRCELDELYATHLPAITRAYEASGWRVTWDLPRGTGSLHFRLPAATPGGA